METLLKVELVEKIFSENLEATKSDSIKALLQLACGAFMAVGEEFQKVKAELGGNFASWLDEEGFARGDTNKLIKLFEYFGGDAEKLLEVGPLPLLRLCVPNYESARDKLRERLELDDTPMTQQEVDAIRIAHKPATLPRRIASKNSASMIGNQPGGTAIFRMEVKDGVLASQCHESFKQSGGSFDSWMRQLLSSFGLADELANTVLGKGISHVSDIDILRTALEDKSLLLTNEQESSLLSISQTQFADFECQLPSQVQDCILKLLCLDEKIARCTNPVGSEALTQRMYLEERRGIESQIQLLCQEFGLDYKAVMNDIKLLRQPMIAV